MPARIVRFASTGDPEVLQIVEEHVPPPPPGEITMAVRAFGLNRAEMLFREGRYAEAPEFPARLGYEATGTVAAIGEEVTGFAIGDAISLIPLSSLTRWGSWGERVNLPASHLVRHGTDIGWERLAAVWMASCTAYGALIDITGLTEGDTLLITAPSSSVGLAAIQLARAVGAHPIAVTSSPDKSERLLAAGATEVIVAPNEDIADRVAAATDGQGARVAFDPVGGPQIEALATALCRGGTIILYGRLDQRPTPLPLLDAIGKGLTLRGFVFSDFVANEANRRAIADFTLSALAAGSLDPVIDSIYPLSDIAAACTRVESGEQFGKVVVQVEQP